MNRAERRALIHSPFSDRRTFYTEDAEFTAAQTGIAWEIWLAFNESETNLPQGLYEDHHWTLWESQI